MKLSAHQPRLYMVLFAVHCPPSSHVTHLAQWIHSPCEQLCKVFILGLVSAYMKHNLYLTSSQLKEHFSHQFWSFGYFTLSRKSVVWLAITLTTDNFYDGYLPAETRLIHLFRKWYISEVSDFWESPGNTWLRVAVNQWPDMTAPYSLQWMNFWVLLYPSFWMSSSSSVNSYLQEKWHSSFQKAWKMLILLWNRLCEHVTGAAYFFLFPDSVIKLTQVRAEINAFAFSSKCQSGDDRLYL